MNESLYQVSCSETGQNEACVWFKDWFDPVVALTLMFNDIPVHLYSSDFLCCLYLPFRVSLQ